MNHPAVSIIIPAFNAEEHIESCINSCLTQTIDQNFEIIICDDASTDTTVDIINFLYNDYENIILLKNELNIGVGGTRNKAIKNAKGRYIFLLDADDYIHPNTLNILTTFLELRPDIDMAYSDYVYVDNKDQKSRRIDANHRPIACSRIIRKSIYAKHGLYSNVRIGEEKEFAERLNQLGVTKLHIQLPLYRYRQHDLSITSEYERNRSYDCNKIDE